MKAFPFAIWPNTLVKAGPPESNAYHEARRLDPTRSYSVPSATRVVDPGRSYQYAKYIDPAVLNSMEGYQHEDQKATNVSSGVIRAHPTRSVYDRDPEEGYLPAGHAHRNADIKGRLHFLASADHDAAFHELSDLYRIIGAIPNPTPEQYDMLNYAEKRLQKAEYDLTHARTGHASALAEPMMGRADTHHPGDPGKYAQDVLMRQQNALSPDVTQFPAVSFDMDADPGTGRPARSAVEMAKRMALRGSTPFLVAYLAGQGGFIPEMHLEQALKDMSHKLIYMPQTPEEVVNAYRDLAQARRNHPQRGLNNSASRNPFHVADGTSDWGDYSQKPLIARAFRPQNPEWTRRGDPSSSGRVATLQNILNTFYKAYKR